jgi:nicotinate dehydrogenase subunit B
VALAAERLGIPASDLVTADGVVSVRSDAARRLSYGELVAGRKFNVPLNQQAKRKPVSEWKVMGTSAPRLDMASMVTGRFEFVQNVRLPGMLHGRVVRPSSVGATVGGVDESSIKDIPGIVKVVVHKNFVGVVAEKQWQAIQAANRLKVDWVPGAPLPDQRTFYAALRKMPQRDLMVVDSKDVDATLGKATKVFRSTYLHPYQMHGSIGTSCAVADVRDGKATIWSPTQSAWPLRSGSAMVLGLKPEDVRVIFTRGAGCYGINGADTVSYDAALLSQAVGRPVRVQLSRKDEMAWENFGNAYVIDQRVGVGPDGTIVAWDYEAWFASLGGRPQYERPGNVITGTLAGFEPAVITARPAAEPKEFDNGANAAPSYVSGAVGGTGHGTGTIRSERVLAHTVPSPFYTGPLRSPSRLQNTFAHECFLDEVAADVKADPVEYRLRHLRDERLRECVRVAAKTSGWDARPSPRPGISRTGVSQGRGIACVLYEGDNGYCAMVADVEVNQGTGVVTVKRLVMGHDCGPVSNPDGVQNQAEGGALQGLSRALGEEVTWSDKNVTSIDWASYRSLSLGHVMPAMQVVQINRPDVRAMGAGETSITLTAAAVGNAIFDATGARIREVPFTRERVLAALKARSAATATGAE